MFEVSKILEKPSESLTDFENTLIAGLHWFSSAQLQAEADQELLFLTICLETFLSSSSQDKIINSIAEGVALLLKKDLNSRKSLKKRMKDLYGLRSKVAHGGKKPILTADVSELCAYVFRFLMLMIEWRSRFSTKKELLDMIEDMKLS